jgi:hypothetical protein
MCGNCYSVSGLLVAAAAAVTRNPFFRLASNNHRCAAGRKFSRNR